MTAVYCDRAGPESPELASFECVTHTQNFYALRKKQIKKHLGIRTQAGILTLHTEVLHHINFALKPYGITITLI